MSAQLRRLAKSANTSLHNVLLGGFYVLLGKLCGQSDVVVGLPSDNRDHRQVQDLIGLFTNTLAVRMQGDWQADFAAMLQQVHTQVTQAKVHQALPFEQVVKAVGVSRDSSRHPLFQVMFSLEQFGETLDGPFKPVELNDLYCKAKFDLSLLLNDADEIFGVFNYASSLFDGTTVERFARLYERVLQAMVAERPVDWLCDDERELLELWAQGGASCAGGLSVIELFEATVAEHPERTALVDSARRMSYQALNQRANQIARAIHERIEVTPGTPVGLCLERNLDMVAAMLGVMKAGAAYVPIALSYPDERIAFMVQDTAMPLVICDNAERFAATQALSLAECDGICGEPLNVVTDIDAPAYVLYTSGTTGQPKGVVMTGRPLATFIEDMVVKLGGEAVNCLSLTQYTFDIFALEYAAPLVSGGTLYLSHAEGALADAAEHGGDINFVQMTPSMAQMLDELSLPQAQVMIGGESAPASLFESLAGRFGKVHQVYGPTETCIWSTHKFYQSGESKLIGKPLPGESVYVLDEHGERVPVGVPGELYIGGAGLAEGYLNRPELTAERFADGRYKTGDRVRWRADGMLEYLGRNDAQVKVRGHRIELGEVESALLSFDGVSRAAVVEHDGALAAYVVGSDAGLDAWLAGKLPQYMVPAAIMVVDDIPMTVNGKLDRNALPAPEHAADAYVAPVTPLQARLCEIWQAILGVGRVGVMDNFFALGGHSLLATQLVGAIGRDLKRQLPLAVLFEQPTVSGLAASLGDSSAEVIEAQGLQAYPLSYAQQRMWFIEQMEQGSDAYHIIYALDLADGIELDAVEQAINVIAKRHPVLNGVYSDEHWQMRNSTIVIVHGEPDVHQPFDLRREASLRVYWHDERLVLVWHHIAYDGWSMNVFLHELACLLVGEPLPELAIHYGDHACWQRDLVLDDGYWRAHLGGFETLHLPTDRPRPVHPDYVGQDIELELEGDWTGFAKHHQTTAYSVLLSGFYVTLATLSGQTDIVIGTPTDNREHGQTQDLIGLFVNSLALRLQLDHHASITQLLGAVHQVVMQGKAHQQVPFEHLVDTLGVERDTSRHPIFQVMFSWLTLDDEPDRPFTQASLPDYSPAKFDLSLFVTERAGRLSGCLNFATALFDEATARRITVLYRRVLEGFMADASQRVGDLDLLSHVERHQLQLLNGPVNPLPETGLVALFEAQVEQTPDKVALYCGERSISYRDLSRLANQLAQKLPQNEPIALYQDRSIDMIVAMLAVLKAGSAYVPIATNTPADRIRFMLEDTQAPVVLTQSHHIDALATLTQAQFLTLEDAQAQPTENLGRSGELAYVIYTSGTTGQPKGVMVSQRNVLNYVQSQRAIDYERADFSGNFAFDLTVTTTLCPLLLGRSIAIYSGDITDSNAYKAHLAQHRVEFVKTTPSLAQLLDIKVKTLMLGGEALSEQMLAALKANCDVIYDEYGPTEATVGATLAQVWPERDYGVGKAYPNVLLKVLNPNGQPVPPGCPGELYIGGEGVAQGYFNRPDLTDVSFTDGFYKTGDRVRQLEDGSVAYLGRTDRQLKIRGMRIEPGEVEAALVSLDVVSLATVIEYRQSLVAYVVAERQVELVELEGILPAYMVPASIVMVDAMPLNTNGKVDLQALPEPASIAERYVAPRTEQERELCKIWQTELSIDKVGIEDNFFAIGGNSLSAIKLIKAIEDTLGCHLPIRALFEQQTISRLVGLLEVRESRQINRQNLRVWPLTPAQQRLLFIEQFEQGSDLYHVHSLLRLHHDFDAQTFELAVNYIAGRHPVLNVVFVDDEQRLRDAPLRLETGNFSQAQADAARPFDLTSEPPFRMHYYPDGEHLLLVWHHIAFDGWSTDLFFAELSQLLRGQTLPEQPVHYGDYACWLSGQTDNDQALAWWQQHLAGAEVLDLPTDFARPARQDHRGGEVAFTLSADLSARLQQLAARNGVSLNSVMMAGAYLLLARWSAQDDVVLGTPSENRLLGQTQDMIGLFTNTLALRQSVDLNLPVADWLKRVHQTVSQAKEYQSQPFEQLVDMLEPVRDLSRHPIFQVLFSLQSFGESALDDGDLPFGRATQDGTANPARFDLSVLLTRHERHIDGVFNYALSLFETDTIRRMVEAYQLILQAMVAASEQALGQIALMDSAQKQQVLEVWNRTATPHDINIGFIERFEKQASTTPDAAALKFGDDCWSYRALEQRANQLANAILNNATVTADSVIALYFERSMDMIAAMLGVMKAGAAYVPISPAYPAERTAHILEDTATPLVLTQSHLARRVKGNAAVLCVEDCGEYEQSRAQAVARADDPAYVIYTSGTTGKPKGVVISQGTFGGFIANILQAMEIDRVDALVLTQYTFDIFCLEYGVSLLSGGTLVLSDIHSAAVDVPRHAETVNFMQQTPSMWQTLLPMLPDELPLSHIQIMIGGESAPKALFDQLARRFGTIHQMYGPTETCIGSTYTRYEPGHEHVIGKPLPGESVYVLDKQGQPVPVGVPGELYIGGVGLALGYLNRPDLTAQRFVDGRYRTGDKVRWRSDGQLEYLGRTDAQVKIRGHRIELAEIESVLLGFESVTGAAVIEHEGALVAYVVGCDADLNARLATTLPEYMVPALIMAVDAIPLTINGKLDRRALPAPDFVDGAEYVPPATFLEARLCETWQAVLGVNLVGTTESFFALGGHSMLATQLVAAIARDLGCQLPLVKLFEQPTVAELARYFEDSGSWQPSADEGYWVEHLEGMQRLNLFIDRPRSSQQGGHGQTIEFDVDGDWAAFAKSHQTTVSTVLLSGLYVTLATLSGQSDIVVGTPADRLGDDEQSGNAMALRIHLDHHASIAELIKQVHLVVVQGKGHQQVPFGQVIEALGIAPDVACHPIFQVMFGFGAEQTQLAAQSELARCDLGLFIGQGEGRLTGRLDFATALFDEASARRIALLYRRVLNGFMLDGDKRVGDLQLLGNVERHQLQQLDGPMVKVPDITLPLLFESRVELMPNKAAVYCDGAGLTYRELNQLANQLAHKLPQNQTIALYFERSIDMVVAMLAVLKAGSAYVAIEPECDESRIRTILKDTEAPVVLARSESLAKLQSLTQVQLLTLQDSQGQPNDNLNRAGQRVCVSYTADLKAVETTRFDVLNYVQAQAMDYERTDFSAFERALTTCLCPLLLGHTVAIYTGKLTDGQAYRKHLESHAVEFVKTTPSLALELGFKVKTLMLCDEPMTEQALQTLKANADIIYYEHGYHTTAATLAQLWPEQDSGIGKVYPNVYLQVLNPVGQPVPPGCPGELFIVDGDTLVKTGDIVRLLSDGCLAYVKRQ